MKKTLFYLINIFSFGTYYVYLKNKAKKNAGNVNKKLIISNKIDFNIKSFIDDLGGINNIKTVNSLISTVKIVFFDIKKIKELEFIKKKYRIKGCIKNEMSITFLFGDTSKTICELIANYKK